MSSAAKQPKPAAVPWQAAAWVSGVFCFLLALALAAGHLGTRAEDPLKSPELKRLKEKLRATPTDEATKQRIRQLDLQLRTTYFRQLSRLELGVYLLGGGAVVFVYSWRRRLRIEKQPPMPAPKPDAEERSVTVARQARWSVAAGGGLVGVLLFLLTLSASTPLPQSAKELDKLLGGGDAEASGPDAAPLEEMRANWPSFRGLFGAGSWPGTNAPVKWDPKNGEGVLWKVPNPGPGFNSPLVWGNRVFYSGGDEQLREVYCLDGNSGQMLWRQAVTNVPGAPAKVPEVPESTGYAAPTMATDGRRVYVIFATGDVAAYTLEGRLLWSKYFGPLENPYGHAISLATWKDRLLLQLDQGDGEEAKSKLCAVDGRTGRVLWQKPRPVGASWASPITFEAGGKAQVVTLALPSVVSYSVDDGAELWKVECLNGEVTPSPVFAAGFVFVASPSEKLVAIRPDGKGDVAKSHVAWEVEDSIPDVSSPASNGEFVFMVTTSGLATCLDAKDGKKVWEHDYEMEVHASPAAAGNHLYILGQKGVTVVVEIGRQYKEVFRTEVPDAFHASPAFGAGRIYLRGVTNVWCFGR